MKKLLPVIMFFGRHFLIVPLGALAGCILWTAIYFVLLLVAIIGDKGIGGPLAYPAGIAAVILPCIVLGWGVFAPSCGIGVLFCAILKINRFWAIPVVFIAAFLLSWLGYWVFIQNVTTHSMPPPTVVLRSYVIYLSLPLGVYWWLTEGPGALFEALRKLWRRHQSANAVEQPPDARP